MYSRRCVKLQFAAKTTTMDLRSALNLHGSNLLVHPAHALQRGVVIAQLKLTTGHVLILEDHHASLLVVLQRGSKRRFSTTWSEAQCEES